MFNIIHNGQRNVDFVINVIDCGFYLLFNQRLEKEGQIMPKYRKKPVIIEAVQWNGENVREIINFCKKNVRFEFNNYGKDINLTIKTLEGDHLAKAGDYIIKGVKGEFYPCKPDIFHETYEEVMSNES